MARGWKGAQLIRGSILPGIAGLIFALPLHAQPNAGNATPQEPGTKATEAQKPTQAPANAQTEQSPADAKPDAPGSVQPELSRADQIAADTKELYRLSAELRAEVAKTYKDALSMAVLKKAEQVEKLARNLKVLMTAEAADNKHKNQ